MKTFSLDPRVARWLHEESEREGISEQELLNRLVQQYVDQDLLVTKVNTSAAGADYAPKARDKNLRSARSTSFEEC